MKKQFTIVAVVVALTCCIFAGAACSSESASDDSSSSSESSAIDTSEYTDDSLIAVHENLGSNIQDVTEVSVEACTGSGCHGGSWDSVVEETDAYWEGIGQIDDANPHASHGSGGFVCANCHNLVGTSVNTCNQCHNFESPEGWVDKDYTTTTYGMIEDEPLY